jgi:cold shock CspA family protein/ribosome-associated translation inhibitor RaiA
MELGVQITFKNMDPAPAVEAKARVKAARLYRFYDRILGCRVVIEAPHRHHRKGRQYRIGIVLTVPGRDIFVTHEGPENPAHTDVMVALRDAFDAARRRLEDHARELRGQIKVHEPPIHGRIARLFEDYGFIETSDGQEVYFHPHSLVEGEFKSLEPGDEVRLTIAENESAKGPQASTVHRVGKHHPVG